MIRRAMIPMLAAGLSLTSVADRAGAAEPAHHTRKAARIKKAPGPGAAASPPHSINAPSTDFSKIERGDNESSGPDGPTFRPSMGAGGMGLGGSF